MSKYGSWLSKNQIPGISKKSKYRSSRKSFFCRNVIRNTQSSIWNTLTLHENWLTSVISNLALKNAFFTAMKTKFLACTLNIIRTQRGSKLSCQLWSFQLWIKKTGFLSHRKVKRTRYNRQSITICPPLDFQSYVRLWSNTMRFFLFGKINLTFDLGWIFLFLFSLALDLSLSSRH